MLTLDESWRKQLAECARFSRFAHLSAGLFLEAAHLVAIIVPSPLSLYCDASGKEEDELLAVAGFVGRVDEWLKFETEWKAVLDEFKVPYFHMREFAHSVGPFEHWKGREARRIAFIDALIAALAPHASYWMGACILRSDYMRANADWKLSEGLAPYTICAKFCVDQTNDWRDIHWPTIPVEYFFECGDPHKGQLMERVRAATGVDPIFRNRDTVPLQAADFAAWEILKAYRRLVVETDSLYESCRKSFRRLFAIPGKWGQFEEHGLRELCRVSGIAPRH